MKEILLKILVLLLIFAGEGLAIYAEMIGARDNNIATQSFLNIFLKMFLVIAVAGAFLIAGYMLGFNSFKNIPEHRIKNQHIKIREMPDGIKFKSSLWIIEDDLMHFSGKPPFLVVIQNELIVFSIKSIFDFLWNISEPKN